MKSPLQMFQPRLSHFQVSKCTGVAHALLWARVRVAARACPGLPRSGMMKLLTGILTKVPSYSGCLLESSLSFALDMLQHEAGSLFCGSSFHFD